MTMTIQAGTCNFACWMAQEDACHCMCNGANHGIMRRGGDQPGRFMQRKGRQFRLEALCKSFSEARKTADTLGRARNAADGKPWWHESAIDERATGHALKWPEVQNWMREHGVNPDPRTRSYNDGPFLVWVLL